MKIAVLGAGSVGGALGKQFAEVGHSVAFGVPTPDDEKYSKLVGSISGDARVTGVADAARDAEIVVLATPWDATKDAIEEAGALHGKVVVDCTNPLKMGAGGLDLALGFDTSGGEKVAEWAKGAQVVKCFNQTGFANMANPIYDGVRTAMFVCGEDAVSRELVRTLASEIGFDAVDAGGIAVARYLEPLAMLWIHLAFTTPLGREFAFAIVRR